MSGVLRTIVDANSVSENESSCLTMVNPVLSRLSSHALSQRAKIAKARLSNHVPSQRAKIAQARQSSHAPSQRAKIAQARQ